MVLRPLTLQFQENTVHYFLNEFPLNPYVGKMITLKLTGGQKCVHCSRKISKSFGQGYCFVCFQKLPECDFCYISPDRCHFSQGTCRDSAWGQSICFSPHYLYLSWTSQPKIGLTRKNGSLFQRWGHQGAIAGLLLAEVSDRNLAGLLEKHLSSFVQDKTHWKKMLLASNLLDLEQRQKIESELLDLKKMLLPFLEEEVKKLGREKDVMLEGKNKDFSWPVHFLHFPCNPYNPCNRLQGTQDFKDVTLKAYPLEKTLEITARLEAIKAQYFLFKEGIINLKKYFGYEYHLEVQE